MSDPPVFLFDGVCVLCSRAVRYVLKHEKTQDMRFVAIQSETGRQMALENGIDPDVPKTFLLKMNDEMLESSDAALAVLKYAGGPLSFLRIVRFVPKPIRDFAYLFVAKNRYKVFGKTDVCMVPEPSTRDRFEMPS